MTQEDIITKPKSEMDKLESKLGILIWMKIIILCLVCYKLGREHGKAISESQVSFNPITYPIT